MANLVLGPILGQIPSPNPIDPEPILFVQAYIHGKPYFLAGERTDPGWNKEDKSLDLLCKQLLAKLNIVPGADELNKHFPKDKPYSFVGFGEIKEATPIATMDSTSTTHYIILPYNLNFPSIYHFKQIASYFPCPLLFAGPDYHTQEECGFLNFDPEAHFNESNIDLVTDDSF